MHTIEARIINRAVDNYAFAARMAAWTRKPRKAKHNAHQAERKRLDALRLTVLALAPEIRA
jgi:hypothetical protein